MTTSILDTSSDLCICSSKAEPTNTALPSLLHSLLPDCESSVQAVKLFPGEIYDWQLQ